VRREGGREEGIRDSKRPDHQGPIGRNSDRETIRHVL